VDSQECSDLVDITERERETQLLKQNTVAGFQKLSISPPDFKGPRAAEGLQIHP
jgi:hypothetical protein